MDELTRIANRLEREDAERCAGIAPLMLKFGGADQIKASAQPGATGEPAAVEPARSDDAALSSTRNSAGSTVDAPHQKRRRGRRAEERLRKLLKVQAGERPRRHFRSTLQCSEVNGILWPLPSDLDPDPIATLRGDCAAAFHALDKPAAPNVVEGIPA